LTGRRLAEIDRWFEYTIKSRFNPYEETCETEFEIPISGVPDDLDVGLEEGYLKLLKYIFAMAVLTILGTRLKAFLLQSLTKYMILSIIRFDMLTA
jgi:hypothetical protein